MTAFDKAWGVVKYSEEERKATENSLKCPKCGGPLRLIPAHNKPGTSGTVGWDTFCLKCDPSSKGKGLKNTT